MTESRVPPVECWGIHEVTLSGPSSGNPFQDVSVSASFAYRNRTVEVDGFYDGEGTYRIRFMPDRPGRWRYATRSNVARLDGHSGEFTCVPAGPQNHGPVEVDGRRTFRYADGTRYLPVGTTCYHWTHDMDLEQEEATLRSLSAAPFTKVRMCLLPTRSMAPPHLAFAGHEPGRLDTSRFNPTFFAHVERRLADLLSLGIEADLILLHPYDRGHWGVDTMSREEDFRYVRYTLARLAAYRNVWWSIANEYDFNKAKTVEDWDRLGQFVQRHDPYQRLRSIHNGTRMYEASHLYDFGRPWITHQSIQHWDAGRTGAWLAECPKPVVIDEISYEGDTDRRWGNITADEMTHRFWTGMAAGGHVGHGESFQDRETGPWISKGGELYGQSPPRIAFLRKIFEDGPADWIAARRGGDYRLEYLGAGQPAAAEVDLPPDASYRIELIDTQACTVEELPGTYRGACRIQLPGRPYLALRMRRVSRS